MSPHEFAESRLGITVWPKMAEIFSAVEAGHRKILVRSCNGAGKTTALAALCNWYLSQHDNSIVLTTSSSWMQVRRTLWGEIRKQARNAELYKDKNGNLLKLNETSIKLTDKHYAIGISPDRPENAQGFHAPHMLIAVDEATGVDREIIDALSGNLTGEDAQMVLICNPINMQSYPYEAESSVDWHLITISAFDHPNVANDCEDIHGAVTRRWIEDRLVAWSNIIDRPKEHPAKGVILNGVFRSEAEEDEVKDRMGLDSTLEDKRSFAPQDSAFASSCSPLRMTIIRELSIFHGWIPGTKRLPSLRAASAANGRITMQKVLFRWT
ncbi:MAG TPA: hypothetical protein VG537_03850 [Candidatus Kapabacteria bacterium]|jgi:hypothetical protein|nr:hypothetical protein [Candidatus Kapabacteria bacterium]